MTYHQALRDIFEDQLSLASIHYLRSHYQEAIDIYKRILLDNRQVDPAVTSYCSQPSHYRSIPTDAIMGPTPPRPLWVQPHRGHYGFIPNPTEAIMGPSPLRPLWVQPHRGHYRSYPTEAIIGPILHRGHYGSNPTEAIMGPTPPRPLWVHPH